MQPVHVGISPYVVDLKMAMQSRANNAEPTIFEKLNRCKNRLARASDRAIRANRREDDSDWSNSR